MRKSGDPYFCHPCAVSIILTDLMLDATTIAAALLHDCVEDIEEVTIETIEKEFGVDVAVLVDGVTETGELSCRTMGGRLVRVKGDEALIGKFLNVTVTGSNTWALYGEMNDE